MPKAIYSEQYLRFQQLLVEARKAANLTQAQVAGRLSKPQSYVAKYEGGERRLDVIEFLEVAGAIRFDPTEFIRELTGKTPPRPRASGRGSQRSR